MARMDAEALRRRREQLEAELRELRDQERNATERKHAIAGRVVLAHALKDQAFAEQLTALLDQALTKRKERRLFSLATDAAEPGDDGPIGPASTAAAAASASASSS